jgi:putative ABC transport system ATP-binding protein
VARAIVTEPALILADEPTGNLDTLASDEVMAIFSDLNGTGRTVVLITHEADIARYARRVVRVRDGLIFSDDESAPVAASFGPAGTDTGS